MKKTSAGNITKVFYNWYVQKSGEVIKGSFVLNMADTKKEFHKVFINN